MYSPKMSTDPKNGIFIDYLFGWEDHEVLLTLLQGVDGKLKDCPDKIDNIKNWCKLKLIALPFQSRCPGYLLLQTELCQSQSAIVQNLMQME